MTDAAALFWTCALLVLFVGPLLILAFFVEVLAPNSRRWIRRLRDMERGRQAQRNTPTIYGDTQ